MANKDFLGVYPWSAIEAKRLNELDRWRASYKENVACKKAIEGAIHRDFDGMHLAADCAKSVIEQFGYHRTAYVLANSLKSKDDDGRFSHSNADFAKRTYIPSDKDHNLAFAADSHPAVLDGFKVRVTSAEVTEQTSSAAHLTGGTMFPLFDSPPDCQTPPAYGVDGCEDATTVPSPLGEHGGHAGGGNWFPPARRTVSKANFASFAKDACALLEQLQGQKQTSDESPAMGGMTMQ